MKPNKNKNPENQENQEENIMSTVLEVTTEVVVVEALKGKVTDPGRMKRRAMTASKKSRRDASPCFTGAASPQLRSEQTR